jgi:hypothetical protein
MSFNLIPCIIDEEELMNFNKMDFEGNDSELKK